MPAAPAAPSYQLSHVEGSGFRVKPLNARLIPLNSKSRTLTLTVKPKTTECAFEVQSLPSGAQAPGAVRMPTGLTVEDLTGFMV